MALWHCCVFLQLKLSDVFLKKKIWRPLFQLFSPVRHKFCTPPQFLVCHAVPQNLLFGGAAESKVRVLLEVTVGNMVLGQISSSQRLCADAAPFFTPPPPAPVGRYRNIAISNLHTIAVSTLILTYILLKAKFVFCNFLPLVTIFMSSFFIPCPRREKLGNTGQCMMIQNWITVQQTHLLWQYMFLQVWLNTDWTTKDRYPRGRFVILSPKIITRRSLM